MARLPKPKAVCPQCFTQFQRIGKKVFCSDECKEKANPKAASPKVQLICPHCEKPFIRTGRHQRFCRYECGEAYRNNNRRRVNKISHPQSNTFNFYGKKLTQKREKDIAALLLGELCNAVDAIGGVRKDGDGFVLALGINKPKIVSAYLSACKILERQVKVIGEFSECQDCGMLMEDCVCVYCHPKPPIVEKCSVFIFGGDWKEAS